MPHRQNRPYADPSDGVRDGEREKICASCGRTFQWRAKWASNWDEVTYCSNACRRRGVSRVDRQLETAIARLLHHSSEAVTPEAAARAVTPEAWQPLYEPARRAARRLAHRGEVVIVQEGRVVEASSVRGPFSIRTAVVTR